MQEFLNGVEPVWCTIYDYPLVSTYEFQTYYVMFLAGKGEEGGSYHAIPMFTDFSLRYAGVMRDRRSMQLALPPYTEDEFAIYDSLNVVDDTFATVCDSKYPRRILMRKIIVGETTPDGKHFTIYEEINGKVYSLAYLSTERREKFGRTGSSEIMTDFEVHDRILRYMPFPY